MLTRSKCKYIGGGVTVVQGEQLIPSFYRPYTETRLLVPDFSLRLCEAEFRLCFIAVRVYDYLCDPCLHWLIKWADTAASRVPDVSTTF